MLQPTKRLWKHFFSLMTMLYVSQSRLFLIISSFIILSYILILVIRIIWLYQFLSSSYYYYYYFIKMVITINIIIIILCVNSKHVKRCKIWICDPWYLFLRKQ